MRIKTSQYSLWREKGLGKTPDQSSILALMCGCPTLRPRGFSSPQFRSDLSSNDNHTAQ